MALLILYAGRNNCLLWLTSWSYSTFLLLHRWIAIICTIQACLHSAIYLQQYVAVYHEHSTESKLPYWVWGVVSTLALVILLPASILPFRRKLYELFLASHFVLALLAVLGYYYHIVYRFGHQWGYETWAFIAFAIWAFDRVVRVLRMLRNGVLTGKVTVIDEDYIRLDILGVTASGQAYLYFPSLTWRLWENHPFSVAGGLTFQNQFGSNDDDVNEEEVEKRDTKRPQLSELSASSNESVNGRPHTSIGLTFFIRTHSGATNLLRSKETVPLLIESSYGESLLHNNQHELDKLPNLVCVAGGVGITAVLPLLAKHTGYRKLYWGTRTPALAGAMKTVWRQDSFSGLEKHIVIGERMDLQDILRREIDQESKHREGTTILVSGPPGMADEVRSTVSRLARSEKTAVIRFVEESYSW